MSFVVPVYQRKQPNGGLTWTTVGLGPFTQKHSGRHAAKVQKKLIERLKHVARSVKPIQLVHFELTRGTNLVRVRLELTLKGDEGRHKVAGLFPLIIEPRWRSEGERMHIAYHPERQQEWFPLRSDATTEEAAKRYFQKVWANLSKQDVNDLKSDGKDRLRSVSFSVRTSTLLDRVEKDASPWADLEPKREKQQGFKVLARIASDLTESVAEPSFDVGRPRAPYRDQLAQLLCGTDKRSTVVIGEPGVGKTTLLYRLVRDLLEAEDYPTHQNLDQVHHVFVTSGRRIIAGMKHRGEWEQRVVELLEDVRSHRVLLMVEDLHTFGRVGQSRDSSRCLADVLRGPVARGEIVLIGECTEEQFRRLEYEAAPFADLFTRVVVQPATPVETLQLVFQKGRELEREERVAFSPFAYRAIVEQGGALLSGSELPGKSLRVLEQVAQQDELSEDIEPKDDGTYELGRKVEPADVVRWLSARTGLPSLLIESNQTLSAAEVDAKVGRRVLGQAAALDAARDLILRIKSALVDQNRPFAVYLLTGPTGTGKTELAKAINEFLYGDPERLVRFDMGEFSGPDAVARLIGDRYQPQGLLTSKLMAQPFSVVLLDEIEKAHPAVMNLLLQLFDDGRLSDAAGDTADFKRAVVLLTSNLGAQPRAPVGFGDSQGRVLQDVAQAVREFFAPELFNRIDRVVPFGPLSRETARAIVENELSKLVSRRGLSDRNVFVFTHASAAKEAVDAAFAARDGARSVKRYLEREVASLLSAELARGGEAASRVFRLYHTETMRLHSEPLSEAEPLYTDLPLEPLLGWGVEELRAELPRWLTQVREALEPKALAALEERMRQEVRRHQEEGSAAAADAAYVFDLLRGELRQLGELLDGWVHIDAHAEEAERELKLEGVEYVSPDPDYPEHRKQVRRLVRGETIPRAVRWNKDRILSVASRSTFLARLLPTAHEPTRHSAFIELLQVGAERSSTTARLLPALLESYLAERGELVEAAARYSDGTVGKARSKEELAAFIDKPPLHVVVHLVGPGVLDQWQGETGCHLLSSTSAGSEVVRVQVQPAPEDVPPAALIEANLEESFRFERALDEGLEPIPHNPFGLLPAVRRTHFEPPRLGESSLLEIEDYRLGYADSTHAKSLSEGWKRLWLLRAAARPDEEQS